MCLHGPAFVHYRRRAGDLPVLVHVVSQRARVLRLRRTGQPLASNAAAVLPSSYSSGSRHPDLAFFEAQSPRPPMPRSTLRNTPRDVSRKTRGQDGVAFSFPVGLLHPLQHAGLSRRTTGNAQVDDEQATLARNQLRGSMEHPSLLPSWRLMEPFGASRIEVREAKRLKGMVGTLHPVRAEGANDLLSVCMCDAISHRLKLGKFMFPHGDGCGLSPFCTLV